MRNRNNRMIMRKRKTIWWSIEALMFLMLGIGYAKLEEKAYYSTYSSREVQEIRDKDKFRELHRTAPLKVDSIDSVLKYERHSSRLFSGKSFLPSDKVLLDGELMTNNVVASKMMALVIAEAIWYPIYREDHIRECTPYLVDEDKTYYYINRWLDYWETGHSPEIIIRKTDGKIVSVCCSI